MYFISEVHSGILLAKLSLDVDCINSGVSRISRWEGGARGHFSAKTYAKTKELGTLPATPGLANGEMIHLNEQE